MSSMTDNPVKSALRVLTLLELLANEGQEMSHAALAAALNIPKSSLTQLLKTLIGHGWLSLSANGKGYVVGPKVSSLARRIEGVNDLIAAAPEIIATLASATGETSALNLRKGDEQEVAVTQLSPHRLLSVLHAGDRAPLYATSGGKAILAALAPKALQSYFARVSLEAITPATHRTVESLNADLACIRERGFSISNEEYTPGVVGLAQVLINDRDDVSGAVSVAMPATRFSPAMQSETLVHITRAIAGLSRCLAHSVAAMPLPEVCLATGIPFNEE